MTPLAETHEIIREFVAPYGLSLSDALSPRVSRRYAMVRQGAYAALRDAKPNLSFPFIGRVFNRDHTTILYGIRAHRARMAWIEFVTWAGNPDEQLSLFREAA